MILLNSPLVLFLSLQQTIQTADSLALTEKAFFVLLKTRRSIFSLCLRATCFFSLSISEMTPPCLPPNPFILIFYALHLSPTHTPLASIFLYLLHLSSSPFLPFKDDTSHAEKTAALLLSALSTLSSCSAPRFLSGVSLLVFI